MLVCKTIYIHSDKVDLFPDSGHTKLLAFVVAPALCTVSKPDGSLIIRSN